MRRQHILVLYGSSYGHTALVAQRIADVLTAASHEVVVANADRVITELRASNFDAVIVGSSVIGGKHKRSVQHWVVANVDQLNAMPSAFFSVSGSAAGRDESQQEDARRMLAGFLALTGWRPAITSTIAGAMAFRKYNPFLRWMMRRISRKAGGPTDTSRDHDLTDWTRVALFAQACMALLPREQVRLDAAT